MEAATAEEEEEDERKDDEDDDVNERKQGKEEKKQSIGWARHVNGLATRELDDDMSRRNVQLSKTEPSCRKSGQSGKKSKDRKIDREGRLERQESKVWRKS